MQLVLNLVWSRWLASVVTRTEMKWLAVMLASLTTNVRKLESGPCLWVFMYSPHGELVFPGLTHLIEVESLEEWVCEHIVCGSPVQQVCSLASAREVPASLLSSARRVGGSVRTVMNLFTPLLCYHGTIQPNISCDTDGAVQPSPLGPYHFRHPDENPIPWNIPSD